MKISLRKRIIAFMLSVILLFSGSISSFASELLESDPMAEAAAAVVSEEATEPATEAATEATETSAAIISEEITEATEAVTEEVTEPATEAVTEEATEAAAKEETVEETEEEIVEETETETVEETEESEEETEEETEETEEEKDINLQTKVKGTVIKMTGPSASFPEGKDYSISAKELTSDQKDDVEVALRKMEIENETKVVSYQAYDIKLIVDGVEVQPLGEVKVTFEGGAVEEKVEGAENVEVFHIDEVAQEAQPVTNEVNNNTVEMTTHHFSTYVITTTQKEVTVTVQHRLLSSPDKELYRNTVKTLKAGEQLEDLSVAENYEVVKVVKVTGEKSKETETPIGSEEVLVGNTIYRVYYEKTTGTMTGNVQMFDYQVKPDPIANSFNIASNYSSNSSSSNRVSAGKTNQNDSTTQYTVTLNGANVNGYDSSVSKVTGIITGINYDTGDLIMGRNDAGERLYEPGFFSKKEKTGKQILDGYSLKFSRSGDTYTLESVMEGSDERAKAGSNFYPLEHLINKYPDAANNDGWYNTHNHFFGLRYDVEFSIGDYNGELKYYFKGDDDLWVVLDAKEGGGKVIVDIGGIHQATEANVDIWSVLGVTPTTITDEQRAKKHTLTVLYMERGAGYSNCNMNFTLPNSKIITSTINAVDYSLNVEKTVSGLTREELNELIKTLKFTVSATYKDGTAIPESASVPFAGTVITTNSSDWAFNGDGSFTFTKTLLQQHPYIDDYKYIIKEEGASFENYNVNTTVKVDNNDPTETSEAAITFDISDLTKTVSFTNTYTTSFDVTKIWKDAEDAYETRPDKISFILQWRKIGDTEWINYDSDDEGTEVDVFEMSKPNSSENKWECRVSGLPNYMDGADIEYQAIEQDVPTYYVSTTNGTIITNKFDIKIMKVSSSYTSQSERIPLSGAIFEAIKNDGTTYSGESGTDGYIVWNTIDGKLPNGQYTFYEKIAPTGYALSTERWNIEVKDGVLVVPKDKINFSNGQNGVYTVYFENTALYELPSTGSSGIYWYMIAGMIMMMIATAITYKNRREEVLERIDKR